MIVIQFERRSGSWQSRQDRVALVTGASAGIGEAAARALLGAGFTVYGTSRKAAAGETRDGVVFLPLDVTDDESVAGAVREVLERSGRIDVLVNNAGVGVAGAARRAPSSRPGALFDDQRLRLDPHDPAVLPHMREQGSGRIINVSSVLRIRVPAPFMASMRDQARHRGLLRVAGPRGARARGPGAAGRARLHEDRASTRTSSRSTNPLPLYARRRADLRRADPAGRGEGRRRPRRRRRGDRRRGHRHTTRSCDTRPERSAPAASASCAATCPRPVFDKQIRKTNQLAA